VKYHRRVSSLYHILDTVGPTRNRDPDRPIHFLISYRPRLIALISYRPRFIALLSYRPRSIALLSYRPRLIAMLCPLIVPV
jgi:hypothetical protein